MDHQTFDRLTRLVGTRRSRRTAWQALIAGALLAGTTRRAAAQRCPDSKHRCGNECCPGKCFTGERNPSCKICCTEENKNIICPTSEGAVCCSNDGIDPCAGVREKGVCPKPPEPPDSTCTLGIAGSYRRR
jgi:hypothetical protein